MTDPAKQLSVEHLEFLTKAAISRDVALAAGIYTAAKLSQLPQEFHEWPGRRALPAIVFPWRSFCGEILYQLRPEAPISRSDGSPAKYVFPKGAEMVLNVHPLMEPLVRNTDIPLVICEGTKQTLAAVSALLGAGDRAVVGMPGCYGWSQHRKQIPDLRELATVLRGRKVSLIFDADWKTNRGVWQAAKGLTE